MYLVFKGDSIEAIKEEIKAFLDGRVEKKSIDVEIETVEKPPMQEEKLITLAELRQAFMDAAKIVGRDKAREALKKLGEADSLSTTKPEAYAELMRWCREVTANA